MHATLTLNDTGGVDLYVNGVLRRHSAMPSGITSMLSNDDNVWIGGTSTTPSGRYFRGLIDEARISNVALSPNEFLNHVPEPSTAVLAGIALVGLPWFCWRRRTRI